MEKLTPTQRGVQIFFLLPCSVALNFSLFATPLQGKGPSVEGRFSLEVSQNPKYWCPRCMGSEKNFHSHAAWRSIFAV